MKVIYNSVIPLKGFRAINLFGIIFARKEATPLSDTVKNHEAIHTEQMKETGYIGFYLIYIAEFLLLWCRMKDAELAYFAIRFEKEAYRNQHNKDYIRGRRKYAWRRLPDILKL